MRILANVTLAVILSTCFLVSAVTAADDKSPRLDYHLALSFDLTSGSLSATAQIEVVGGESLSLVVKDLALTGILIQGDDGTANSGTISDGPVLSLAPAPENRTLFISYTYTPEPGTANLINENGITLLHNWYPRPLKRMSYHLDATLPKGFTAITEADHFPLKTEDGKVTGLYHEKLQGLHFVAGPYSISALDVRDGLRIYSLFFPEDANLAPEYLEKAKSYILRYEEMIGPFPYNHYVIVANRLPTGLGMPTFTLLGQAVLRLPFIKDTSLGHEVLHSWFGNSVGVDWSSGNWSEGLTSYLADHLYRADAGEGAQYRKEAIINYHSYVKDDNRMVLADFTSADHNQPMARKVRAVGYSRGMMFFHELHELIGPQQFKTAIRKLYREFKGKIVSWADLERVFSGVSDADISTFFRQRLFRPELPQLALGRAQITATPENHEITFMLTQQTEQPYSLQVPIIVSTVSGDIAITRQIESKEEKITLAVPSRPYALTIDSEYSMMRKLVGDELPATWSRIMGSDEMLVVVAPDSRQIYEPFLKQLVKDNWQIAEQVPANSELRQTNLLLLGMNQRPVRTLFGGLEDVKNGLSLKVTKNPLNSDKVIALISSSSAAESGATVNRLRHYGKFSQLEFQQGRIQQRTTNETDFGIHLALEQLPAGGATAAISSFTNTMAALAEHDVVYLGESHTSMSDHRLQLRVIEALVKHHPDIAIGMEMFPSSSQDALDEYTLEDSTMTEREFLQASRYFDVWGYDFRLFREIFAFAKSRSIPVLGLNLERSIVSSVYRSGSTDSLDPEIMATIPEERDLSLPGYTQRLRLVHGAHVAGGHGSGFESGFIQAQSLWDETMAENIVNHLKKHPGRKMIVIAGSEHTRKDSGIPPRVARRALVKQASVLNIYNGSAPQDLENRADYFFLVAPLELPASPRLGIMLKEHSAEEKYVEITGFTPESNVDNAGVRKGDRLVAVDGFAISTMADIRIALLDADTSSPIVINVERNIAGDDEVLEFKVVPIAAR